MRAICRAPLILFDLIILTIYVEAFKLIGSSLGSFHLHPATSSLFGLNILLSTPLNTLNVRSSFSVRDEASHPQAKTQENYRSVKQ